MTEILAEEPGRELSLLEVARQCGLSRSHFSRAFKATTGLTPRQWRQHHRVDRAKAMLLQKSMNIAEIALACGFDDQSHLTRIFSRCVGVSPASWRRSRA